MIIIFSVLLILLGALVYLLAANPKFQEMGRITFFVGMFMLGQQLQSHTFTFLK